MASKNCADLTAIFDRWQRVEGFLPAYKEAKAARILSLKEFKGC
jgi:hypothetical protein